MIFLVVFLFLLLVNAYFSAAEIALVSVKKIKVQQQADQGNEDARDILNIINDPDQYLSAIQVGITLVGLIEGLYGGEKLAGFIVPVLRYWGMSTWLAHAAALFFSIALITYVTIILGELLPKSVALQYPQKTAFRIASSFKLFTTVFYPFVKLLTASTHFLTRMTGIKGSENQKITEGDLRSILGVAYRQGTLEKSKWVLHDNVFNFYEQTVEKIMTPKEKVIFIEDISTRSAVEDIFRKHNHQIFPVMGKDKKVTGCIYVKDFFMKAQDPLKDIILPTCVISPGQTASELLKNFKDKNRNFAVVVNSAGDLAGVVTMHDIGQVLIGKIP